MGGAAIEAALQEAKDALFPPASRTLRGGTHSSRSQNARWPPCADARQERFRVHLHVDITDPAVTLARFTNGVAVPGSVRDRLLCDATVQPVWVRDHVPVGVGRANRVVPDRTRRLVVHRDHGQCRVPGCARTRVEIHHVQHWDQGGPTETWNLLSLCPRHHRLHHQGVLAIQGNADQPETLVFTAAGGRRLRCCGMPRAGADPIRPAVPYQHPSGERLQRHWIALDPRPG